MTSALYLNGYVLGSDGHLGCEMTECLLYLLLQVQIVWMLQNQPYQHLIRIAFRLLLHQCDDNTKNPVLHLHKAAEACGLGQSLPPYLIGIAGDNGACVGSNSRH